MIKYFGIIVVSAIGLAFSTAHAEHIHHEILAEVKKQEPVVVPNIVPHPDIDDEAFAKIMKGYIVVMMSKAIELMDKENECQP
jgi:hypothetical protein